MLNGKTILGAGFLLSSITYAAYAQAPPPPPPPPVEAGVITAVPAIPFMPTAGAVAFTRRIELEPVKNAPYSATTEFESIQTLGDGNVIRRNDTGTTYRDSQGRTRREQQLTGFGPLSTGQSPKSIIFISDPVAHVSYTLHPDQKRAMKMPMPPMMPRMAMRRGAVGGAVGGAVARGGMMTASIAAEPGAPAVSVSSESSDNSKPNVVFYSQDMIAGSPTSPNAANQLQSQQEDLGVQTMEGVQVKGTRVKTTIPAGSIGNDRPIETVSETWYSPELKTEILSKNNDPRMGETTFRLKNIQRVEPAASLFEVPPDYTVDEPKQFMNRLHSKP